MVKTIKEIMEERHPAPKPSTPEEVIQRVVDRVGKSPKELIAKGLEAKHPQVEPSKESASVKLVKLKKAQGLPLTAKDRYILGFEMLHGEVEEAKEEPVAEVEPEVTQEPGTKETEVSDD